MSTKKTPEVKCQLLIRKPASEVFQAFIDPVITTHFWFTRSSGLLRKGKKVTWEWEMYGVSTEVKVVEIIENEKITFTWGEPSTTVDLIFERMDSDTVYVTIEQYGFDQQGDDLLETIKDSTGGFTTVLDGLKAYLEFGIDLNLIADKNPKMDA